MKKLANKLSGSVLAMINSAKKLGIDYEIIDAKKSLYVLRFRNKKFIFRELLIPKNSATAVKIAWNKDLTRLFLEKANIPIPKGRHFNNYNQAVKYGSQIGFPLVTKANQGTHGTYVIVGIQNKKELKEAVKKLLISHHCVIIEELVAGSDFRILVLGNKILGVIKRVPANVIGDGKSTIGELIKKKNHYPLRISGRIRSLKKIKIDKWSLRLLKRQGFTLKSVPSKNQQVFLRSNANISTGGDSIDVTDIIHPQVAKMAIKAVRAIGLKLGAVDYITKDITKSPQESGGVIIEINANPMITIHEKPFKGKKRIVSKEIVKYCFGIK